tara:strand:+ start:753 stop:1418 length:666 start_codon:yes stop_codon:yes gene_type:complete
MTILWMNDIYTLFDNSSIFEFIPDSSFDFNRKLNAIFRFSLYYSIISFVIFKNNNVFLFPIGVMIITFLFNKDSFVFKDSKYTQSNSIDPSKKEGVIDDVSSCDIPKLNNPFMNLNLFDINKKDVKKACYSYDNESVQNKIDELFDNGLYKDVGDIYSNNNSQNRFYTMPNTDTSNEQIKLANWCYKNPKSCKEGNGIQCSANIYRPLVSRQSNKGDSVAK